MNYSFSEEDVKKVAKGAGTTLIGSSIGKGLFFISQIIIARFLGVEAFGLYTLGFAAVKICEIVAKIGLNTGGMRFVSIYRDNNPSKLKGVLLSATWISLLNGALIGVILYFSSNWIALNVFKKLELVETLQLFSFSIPFIVGMNVVSSLLQGFHTTKYTVYTQEFIQPTANILLVAGFYYAGFKLQGVIYAFILSHLVALAAGIFYFKRLFPQFFKKDIKPVFELKNLIFYSIPLLFVGFLHYFLSWADTLMLGFLGSVKDVGIYRAASQVPLIMPLFLTASNSIYAPLIADLHQKGEMKRLSNIFKTTTRWVSYVTVPIFLFFVFSAKDLMMLFGKEYVDSGYTVLIILSIGQLINCITGGVGFTLTMTGRQSIELLNSGGLVIVNVLLNYLLIPVYGSIGAAVASSISNIAINMFRLLEVNKLYALNPFSNKMLKLILSFLIVGIFVFFIKSKINLFWYFNLFLNFMVVACITGLFLLVFKLESEDRYIFEKIKNKIHFA